MSDSPGSATNSKSDLRRARQRARSVFRQLSDEIKAWIAAELSLSDLEDPTGRRRINQEITALASQTLREELLSWLRERRRKTMARAIRAAYQAIQQAIPQSIAEDELFGTPSLTASDTALNDELHMVDAGLLIDDNDSVAEKLGNQITRQLRVGFSQNEKVSDLGRRVDLIMTDGDADDRAKRGVSGQTIMSKGELIAHDSVQDAYISAATKRYLNNGFRYVVYDAVIDFKTSDICIALNEKVVDILENPGLIAPNHPWCRSGARPILDPNPDDIIQRDDIADDLLGKIEATNSYRPTALDTEREFRPTPLTQQVA